MLLNFFLSDLFCLAQYSPDPFVLSQIAVFHCFLWLSSIPLYICTTISLFNPLSKDILVVPMSRPR